MKILIFLKIFLKNNFSDEDGLGFTVSAPNEVVYKLKAADARNRQRWVDYLRAGKFCHGQRIRVNSF